MTTPEVAYTEIALAQVTVQISNPKQRADLTHNQFPIAPLHSSLWRII